MSQNLIHHSFNEWFWSITGESAPNLLQPTMPGFCTVYTVSQSSFHLDQKMFTNRNRILNSLNNKLRFFPKTDCTQTLENYMSRFCNGLPKKDFKSSHPDRRYTKTLKIFNWIYLQLCNGRGIPSKAQSSVLSNIYLGSCIYCFKISWIIIPHSYLLVLAFPILFSFLFSESLSGFNSHWS